jgi:hypothetical protein
MIKTGSPRTLWDHCIELEALIHSSTCNDIYMTNGEVPETIMTGSTADRSHICEFGWYDWVMFWDNVPAFPDNTLVLGGYLGPVTDVGSALTAKILKSNGQTVCRSTLHHLNDEELHCPIHKELRRSFDKSITHQLGPTAKDTDFPAADLTPEYLTYADDHDLDPDHSNLEVTPEIGDNYLSVEILIPRGGSMIKGCVKSRKRDTDGNPIGRAAANPILDTREYIVEFEDGNEAELNVNLIAEAMYAQCNPDGNQ